MPSSRYFKSDAWIDHPRTKALSLDAHFFLFRLTMSANGYGFIRYDQKFLGVLYDGIEHYLGKTADERKAKVLAILTELTAYHPEGSLIVLSNQYIPLRRSEMSTYKVKIVYVQCLPIFCDNRTTKHKRTFMLPLESEIAVGASGRRAGNLPGALAPGEESVFGSEIVASEAPSKLRMDTSVEALEDEDPWLDETVDEEDENPDFAIQEDDDLPDADFGFDDAPIEEDFALPDTDHLKVDQTYESTADTVAGFMDEAVRLDENLGGLLAILKVQTGMEFTDRNIQTILTNEKADARKVKLYLEYGGDVNLASGTDIYQKIARIARDAMK